MKERLKQLRKTLGLKQREVAERLGVATGRVGSWESGVDVPGESRIYQICKEYGVRREWLESGEGEMFEPKPDARRLSEFEDVEVIRECIQRIYALLPEEAQEKFLEYLNELTSKKEGNAVEGEKKVKSRRRGANVIENSGTINGGISQTSN